MSIVYIKILLYYIIAYSKCYRGDGIDLICMVFKNCFFYMGVLLKGRFEMDIITRIINMLRQRGKKQIELATFLGISNNNISEWKAGRSKSYMKYLPSIADFLGVSMEYLLGTESLPDNTDQELGEYLEILKNRPELKTIFCLLEGATKEDVEQAVRIIEALRGGEKDKGGDGKP